MVRNPFVPTLASDRRRRSLRWYSSLTRWPALNSAVESGLAAGVAYGVGSLLPTGLGEYAYYASLGAFTVTLPTVADALMTGVKTALCLATGILLALTLEILGTPGALLAGLAIGLGVMIGSLPFLDRGRGYVPTAALFTLGIGGTHPDHYATVYLTQLVLGCVVGLAVSYVVVLHTTVPELDRSVLLLRRLLVAQLREIVINLDRQEPPDGGDLVTSPHDLAEAEIRVRRASEEVLRGRRGYPSRRMGRSREEPLLDIAAALRRSRGLLSNATALLAGSADDRPPATRDPEVRRRTATLLSALADVLEAPSAVAAGEVTRLNAVERQADRLLDFTERHPFADRDVRVALQSLAVDARSSARTFAQAYGRQRNPLFGHPDPTPEPEPEDEGGAERAQSSP